MTHAEHLDQAAWLVTLALAKAQAAEVDADILDKLLEAKRDLDARRFQDTESVTQRAQKAQGQR
jgi:hypothetical protein